MFLVSLSALICRSVVIALPRRVIFLAVFLSVSGHSFANPTSQINGDKAAQPKKVKIAPYNKPYRVKGKAYAPMPSASGYKKKGVASWYGSESGNRTASGVRFDPRKLTAAHKTLPIPSTVRVTNLQNGRYVDVVINDRGPFAGNRLIDLSKGAAEKIGVRGLTEVTVEYLDG